jgi:hypothetical protein
LASSIQKRSLDSALVFAKRKILVIRYEAHPEIEVVTIASEPDLVKVYLRYGKRSTP